MLLEDLDPFLRDFGIDSTITSPAFGSRLVRVLFDEEYDPINFGTGTIAIKDAEGRSLTATAKTASCTDVHHGDSIVIEGKTYKIVGIEPIMDGKFTELVLQKI